MPERAMVRRYSCGSRDEGSSLSVMNDFQHEACGGTGCAVAAFGAGSPATMTSLAMSQRRPRRRLQYHRQAGSENAGDVIDVAIFRDAAYERQRDGYRSSGIIRIGGIPVQCHGLRFRNEIE